MAGGEGPRRRRTAKSVDAAVATGPQAPLRRCSSSTKRKASGKEAVAASYGQTPCRLCASPSKTKEDETTAARAEAEKLTAEEEGVKKPQKRRLSAKDMRWISTGDV